MENIDTMTDEPTLRRLLDDSDDLELRRRLRARLRQLKKEANPDIEIDNCCKHDAKVVKPQISSSSNKSSNSSSSSSSQPNDTQKDRREFLEKTNHLRSLPPPSTKTSRPVSSPAPAPPQQPESGVVLRRLPPRPSPGDSEGANRRTESSGARLETVVLRKVEPKTTTKTDQETTRPRSNHAAANKITTKTAFERFRQLDNCSDASKRCLGVDGFAAKRSPSPNSIRDQMLNWCRARVSCYDDVSIDDFSGSWSDGIAFCALVHSFYPESFDFDGLDRKDKAKNFQLAFDTAEEQAGVFPLLDVEDMIRTNSPDWKCVFTYVNCFANRMSEIRKEKKAAELLLREKELGQERQREPEGVK